MKESYFSGKKLMLFFLIIIFIFSSLITSAYYCSKKSTDISPNEAVSLTKNAITEVIFGDLKNREEYLSKDTNKAWDELFSWENLTQEYSEEAKEKVKSDLIYNAKNMAGIVVSPDDENWYKNLMEKLILLDISTKLDNYKLSREEFLNGIKYEKDTEKDTLKGKSYVFSGSDFSDPSQSSTINLSYEKDGWKVEFVELIDVLESLKEGIDNNLSRAEIND